MSSSIGIQISESDDPSMISYAKDNNLSLIYFVDCERELKHYYNIPDNNSIIIQKIDYLSNLNYSNNKTTNESSTVDFNFYSPITYQELNKNICISQNISITVSIPIFNTIGFNLTKYNELMSYGIDGLNASSAYYTSRCISFTDPNSTKDTSPSYRSSNYLQGNRRLLIILASAVCSKGCIYSGLDSDGYLNCTCKNIISKIFNELDMSAKVVLSAINIGIITCYEIAFVVNTCI